MIKFYFKMHRRIEGLNDKNFRYNKMLEHLVKYKFQIFILDCTGIHIAVFFYSLYFGIRSLMMFNIASILIYMLCIFFLMNKKPRFCFYVAYLEIVIHTFAASLILGHKFGFALCFVSVGPVVFSTLHTRGNKRTLVNCLGLGVISYALFAVCYAISLNHEAHFSDPSVDATVPYVYLLNMLNAFISISLYSVIFIVEVDAAYDKLYSKNKELNVLANRDALTGLYNRRTMTQQVMKLFEAYKDNNEIFALVICDIDDFKDVNDSLGHDCGDEVLKTIARTLSSLVREQDYLCRWGGEEFLIMLKNISHDQAMTIAERFRAKIEETEIRYKEFRVGVTMTFGVSSADEGKSYEELFHLADTRLYEGKESGKNTVR